LQLIWPWQDRNRRFSWLKASTFALMLVPAIGEWMRPAKIKLPGILSVTRAAVRLTTPRSSRQADMPAIDDLSFGYRALG